MHAMPIFKTPKDAGQRTLSSMKRWLLASAGSTARSNSALEFRRSFRSVFASTRKIESAKLVPEILLRDRENLELPDNAGAEVTVDWFSGPVCQDLIHHWIVAVCFRNRRQTAGRRTELPNCCSCRRMNCRICIPSSSQRCTQQRQLSYV